MITQEMRRLIERNHVGFVATITPEGRPAVSPKGTSVVMDKTRVAIGDLRSPGTLRNITANPAVEINFLNVLSRKAVRSSGTARYVNGLPGSSPISSLVSGPGAIWLRGCEEYSSLMSRRPNSSSAPSTTSGRMKASCDSAGALTTVREWPILACGEDVRFLPKPVGRKVCCRDRHSERQVPGRD